MIGAQYNHGEDSLHAQLLTLNSNNYVTNDDGTYEIYVVPDTYDVLLDKASYLDCIYISKEVKQGDVLDLGNKTLFVGDLNKDGIISARDMALIQSKYGLKDSDSGFEPSYDFDENQEIARKRCSLYK